MYGTINLTRDSLYSKKKKEKLKWKIFHRVFKYSSLSGKKREGKRGDIEKGRRENLNV